MRHEDRVRIRHTDRRVGLLVILAVAIFVGALIQRGAIMNWFTRGATLTVLLPEEGVAGLAVGAEAQVLGVRAGTVTRVVLEPDQRIRAEVTVDEQAKPFIRQDSKAVIRRRFGVAGPGYLDIERGEGEPMNWNWAVIEATTERAATETAGALLDDLRQRIFPVLEDLQRGMHALAEAATRLERGEGTIGRLLTDDTLARNAESAASRAATALETIQTAARDVQVLTASLAGGANGTAAARNAGPGSLPSLLRRAEQTLAALERASRDVARATPALPQLARNVEASTENLPAVLVQAQETARQLEQLSERLRSSWLLGGGGNTGSDTATPGAAQGGAQGGGRGPVRPAPERVRP